MPLRVVGSSGVIGAAQVVVPDVSGQTEAEAKVSLADFTVRVRTVETSGIAGTVFATDPAKDSVRPKRSLVTIFMIVNPVPDNDDVVAALVELTTAVIQLGTTLETEQSAKDRNDVVLQKLLEIKDGQANGGTGAGSGSGELLVFDPDEAPPDEPVT